MNTSPWCRLTLLSLEFNVWLAYTDVWPEVLKYSQVIHYSSHTNWDAERCTRSMVSMLVLVWGDHADANAYIHVLTWRVPHVVVLNWGGVACRVLFTEPSVFLELLCKLSMCGCNHSFMQRPVHPSFWRENECGRVEIWVTGGGQIKYEGAKKLCLESDRKWCHMCVCCLFRYKKNI